MKALHEIKQYQKSTEHLISKAPMICLMQEIAQNLGHPGIHFQEVAFEAI